MKTLLHMLAAVRDFITDWLAYIGAALMTVMPFIISYDVAARYFFNRPTTWVDGISEWMLLFVTWGGAALVLKEKGHVIIDLVTERLNPKRRALAGFLSSIVGALTCAFLFWASASDCIESMSLGSKIYIQVGYIQRWLVLGIIPISSFLLFFYFVEEAGRCLINALKGGKSDAVSESSYDSN